MCFYFILPKPFLLLRIVVLVEGEYEERVTVASIGSVYPLPYFALQNSLLGSVPNPQNGKESTVAGGKIQTIDCSTPNGSAASQAAVAEATQIAKAALEGKDATKDAITANLPYSSRKADSFSGSVGAKIACDMISNALRNGCTHIVGWSY